MNDLELYNLKLENINYKIRELYDLQYDDLVYRMEKLGLTEELRTEFKILKILNSVLYNGDTSNFYKLKKFTNEMNMTLLGIKKEYENYNNEFTKFISDLHLLIYKMNNLDHSPLLDEETKLWYKKEKRNKRI